MFAYFLTSFCTRTYAADVAHSVYTHDLFHFSVVADRKSVVSGLMLLVIEKAQIRLAIRVVALQLRRCYRDHLCIQGRIQYG